jgi:methionine synthase II (cobalamin-independent)
VRAELEALVKAGCEYTQLDEPVLAPAPHGLSLDAAVDFISRTLDGNPARTAVPAGRSPTGASSRSCLRLSGSGVAY